MSDSNPKVISTGEVHGERDPSSARPLPNRTDAAFEETAALRTEAAELDVENADKLPLGELRQRVEMARAERG